MPHFDANDPVRAPGPGQGDAPDPAEIEPSPAPRAGQLARRRISCGHALSRRLTPAMPAGRRPSACSAARPGRRAARIVPPSRQSRRLWMLWRSRPDGLPS